MAADRHLAWPRAPRTPWHRRRARRASAVNVVWDASVLVEWAHRRGGQAHCLAQLHLQADDDALVVLSEVATNPDHLGLSGDVAGAATALQPVLHRIGIAPQAPTWVLHHGPFSYPEAAGPETWTRTRLTWDGGAYTDDMDSHELITDARALSALARLRSVDQALAVLPATALAS